MYIVKSGGRRDRLLLFFSLKLTNKFKDHVTEDSNSRFLADSDTHGIDFTCIVFSSLWKWWWHQTNTTCLGFTTATPFFALCLCPYAPFETPLPYSPTFSFSFSFYLIKFSKPLIWNLEPVYTLVCVTLIRFQESNLCDARPNIYTVV